MENIYIKHTNICTGYSVLREVKVHASGEFKFSCSRSPELCDCIGSVGGGDIGEQHFRAGALNLILFSHEGHAAYEIQENGEALTYGYVNDALPIPLPSI